MKNRYKHYCWEINGSEDESMIYAEINKLREIYKEYEFKVTEFHDNGVLTAIQLEVY